jgi:peptidoglycan/xylan/chitin deacetylase (PgdA/CDA1 family)
MALTVAAAASMMWPSASQVHAATPLTSLRPPPGSDIANLRPHAGAVVPQPTEDPPRAGHDRPDPTRGPNALQGLVRLGQPIYCGGGSEPLVALTFDDGPGILTHFALQQLHRHDAPATFFLVGKLIGEPQFRGIPRQEAAIGAIGDHTWDHSMMTHGSPAEYERQIGRTREAAENASGEKVTLFRPPFGAHDRKLDAWVRKQGMLEVVWSIDSEDSQGATADRIYRNVKASLTPGDIILLHDNRGTTENALPRILDLLDARGLTPVTVPQLLAQDPPSTKQVEHHTCS